MNDKLPPNDTDAERGILGCILLAPEDCMSECVEKLKPGKYSFYDLKHATLYAVMLAMFTAQMPIDILTLQSHLKQSKKLTEIGGVKYLAELQDSTPTASNLSYYIDKVLDKWVLRTAIARAQGIIDDAMEFTGETDKFLGEAESKILSIRNQFEPGKGIVDQVDCINSLLQKYEEAMRVQGHCGLKTGFKDIDAIIGGLDGPEFVILTGSQSSGKTSLLLNILCNLAKQNIKTGLISLETTAEKIVHRNLCSLSGVNGQRLNMGCPNLGDFQKIAATAGEMVKRKDLILIDDSSGITLQQCQAKMRRMVQLGVKLIGIDYMQLLKTNETGSERLASISQGIKLTGKELNIPIVGISTMTKEETKGDKPPSIDSFFGSVQFQYDMTMGILLWAKASERANDLVKIHCEIGKNKDGKNGSCWLDFYKPAFLFQNHCPIEPEDIPKTKSQTKDD